MKVEAGERCVFFYFLGKNNHMCNVCVFMTLTIILERKRYFNINVNWQ